jgi:DNA mismatch repair ATPase MutL
MNRLLQLDPKSQVLIAATSRYSTLKEVCYELLTVAKESQADYAEVELRKADLLEVRHNGSKPVLESLELLACLSKLKVYCRDSDGCVRYDYSTARTEPCKLLLKPGCILQAASLYHNLPSRLSELADAADTEAKLLTAFNQFSIESPEMVLKLLVHGRLLTSFQPQPFAQRFACVSRIACELRPFYSSSTEVSFRGVITEPKDSVHHTQVQYWLHQGLIFQCEALSSRINAVYKDANRLLNSHYTE